MYKSMDEQEQKVYRTLRVYGAPLSDAFGPGESGSFETMLPQMLSMARRHPVVGRVMPVVFFKNADMDYGRLSKDLNAADRRALGFLMELTYQLSSDERWRKRASDVRLTVEVSPCERFFDTPLTSSRAELENLRTPAVARAWGYFMMTGLEHFKSCFQTFTKRMPCRAV